MRPFASATCRYFFIVAAFAFLLSMRPAPTGFAQELRSPERWESDIKKFEQDITDGTSRPGSILFVGSSSIRKWDLNKSLPGKDTVNHGFGGSELSDAIHFFDRIVLPLKPSIIVLYAGDNDISRGKSAETVHRDFQTFFKLVRSKLDADTPIMFIAIKPSLKRWNLADEIQKANQLIAVDCSAEKGLTFVDIWEPMLGDDGQPQPELFVNDGLHLSDHGYQVWTNALLKAAKADQRGALGL